MKKRPVWVIDTSILCVWLRVSGKDTCGTNDDHWDKPRVDAEIDRAIRGGATLVLPLASIIETGNHIAQGKRSRFDEAKRLAKLLELVADGRSPWAAFTHQLELWSADVLRKLAQKWPHEASAQRSIGDATILDVVRYYQNMGHHVEILTADRELKAGEAAPARRPALVPRRLR